MRTTLRKMLTEEAGLDFSRLEAIFLHRRVLEWMEEDEKPPALPIEQELDREFDSGFGGIEGAAVLAYTPDRIYLSTDYDGAEHVHWIPRHPDPTFKPRHYGGGG